MARKNSTYRGIPHKMQHRKSKSKLKSIAQRSKLGKRKKYYPRKLQRQQYNSYYLHE